ncbi:TonB-dependent receptor plug domain-containing protein, partial [Erythrobacter sp.]|uniref:TonB-dependent receptor plug domain-containing protein n=1 Tax=Erythrobacter sp. TaxID=1042 RepID=UPI00311FEE0D
LEVAQIRTTEDVVARAPNVVFNTVQSRSQVFIRGVGSSFSLAGAESAVAAYQDGTYLQRQGGSTLALFDVASVQVLRGPQSVLYGRNATGGAISVMTNDPVIGVTEGSGEVTYGRFDEYRGQAVLNVPVGDTLAIRVAGMASGNDAVFENDGPGKDIGENRSYYARGKIGWEPTDNFRAVLS